MTDGCLVGPFQLTLEQIARLVTRPSPGVFALGSYEEADFEVRRIGRSDADIGARLKQEIGQFPLFKFRLFDSPREAFEQECTLFHKFSTTLTDKLHPARPRNTTAWQCPRCKVFDY